MAKTKLTEDSIKKACEYIRAGNYAVVVCQYLGINESTYYNWIKKAEEDMQLGTDSIYTKFFESIKKAEAEAEIHNIRIIQTAADTTWQAAAWYLERKHKDRWSAKQITELTGKDGNDLNITIKKV